MKDFNIAKYLRENYLGSHAILAAYVDLHALKEAEDLEGWKMVKDFGAIKDKSVADKYAEVERTGNDDLDVKVVNKDGVYKIYTKAKKELNKEADYGNNQPVDEVPYVGADKKLDGFGDEFDQVAPVEEVNKNHKFKVVIPISGVTRNQLEFMNDNDIDIQDVSDGDDFDNQKNEFTAPNEQVLKLMIAKFYPKRLGLGKKEVLDLINTIEPITAPVEEMDNSMTGDKGWQYDDEDFFPERDKFDRMMDRSHEYIGKVSPIVRKTIESLRADGFGDQDIIDFLASDLS